MQLSEQLRRGDDCLVSYLAHLAATAPGGSAESDDRYLVFVGGHDYPGTFTNGVIRRNNDISPAELLARADARFAELNRPYMVWIRGHADDDLEAEVRARGLWLRPPETGNPGIITMSSPAVPELPAGAEVRRVADDHAAEDFLNTIAYGYELAGAPLELLERLLFSVESMRDDRVIAYQAYLDGQPLAASMMFLDQDTIGCQWAATRPGARGGGLARAVVAHCLTEGFDRGGVCATAVASADGVRVWTRIGYEVVTHYRRYMASGHLTGAAAVRSG